MKDAAADHANPAQATSNPPSNAPLQQQQQPPNPPNNPPCDNPDSTSVLHRIEQKFGISNVPDKPDINGDPSATRTRPGSAKRKCENAPLLEPDQNNGPAPKRACIHGVPSSCTRCTLEKARSAPAPTRDTNRDLNFSIFKDRSAMALSEVVPGLLQNCSNTENLTQPLQLTQCSDPLPYSDAGPLQRQGLAKAARLRKQKAPLNRSTQVCFPFLAFLCHHCATCRPRFQGLDPRARFCRLDPKIQEHFYVQVPSCRTLPVAVWLVGFLLQPTRSVSVGHSVLTAGRDFQDCVLKLDPENRELCYLWAPNQSGSTLVGHVCGNVEMASYATCLRINVSTSALLYSSEASTQCLVGTIHILSIFTPWKVLS